MPIITMTASPSTTREIECCTTIFQHPASCRQDLQDDEPEFDQREAFIETTHLDFGDDNEAAVSLEGKNDKYHLTWGGSWQNKRTRIGRPRRLPPSLFLN